MNNICKEKENLYGNFWTTNIILTYIGYAIVLIWHTLFVASIGDLWLFQWIGVYSCHLLSLGLVIPAYYTNEVWWNQDETLYFLEFLWLGLWTSFASHMAYVSGLYW